MTTLESDNAMAKSQRYCVDTNLPASQEAAFAYHARVGCLQRLLPPWEKTQIESSDDSIEVGSRVVLRVPVVGPVKVRCVAEHVELDSPSRFVDEMRSGPFAAWRHEHDFSSTADGQSHLTDNIRYKLPGGAVGQMVGGGMVRRQLESMFAYRHRVVRDDLRLASEWPVKPMRVAVSGSSGLVGRQFSALLRLLGHDPVPLVRGGVDTSDDAIAPWPDGDGPGKSVPGLDDIGAVIHLAGKSIASNRWTEESKQEIRDSRLIKTRQLCESLAGLSVKPKVLICASATGIYGDRGEEILNEQSSMGDDFLSDVACRWEAACQPAIDAGIRVVHARFGLILSPQGGALQKMLLPAKLMGGKLGSGKQWCSWITIDDAIGALYHCMANEAVSGPVNFVSPEPIRNVDFAKTLGRVLRRPALFPAPAFGLRLAMGEMADALLLASTRAIPTELESCGYRFRFTDLEDGLRYLLGKHRLASQVN